MELQNQSSSLAKRIPPENFGGELCSSKLAKEFALARKAKSIFRAIYTQQDINKAIGQLSLQDIINICSQSEEESSQGKVNGGKHD